VTDSPTDTSPPDTATAPPVQFAAAQATVTLQLTGAWGADQAEIDYHQGHFYLRPMASSGQFLPEYVRAFDAEGMQALSAALTARLQSPPEGLDVAAVRACIALLDALVQDDAGQGPGFDPDRPIVPVPPTKDTLPSDCGGYARRLRSDDLVCASSGAGLSRTTSSCSTGNNSRRCRTIYRPSSAPCLRASTPWASRYSRISSRTRCATSNPRGASTGRASGPCRMTRAGGYCTGTSHSGLTWRGRSALPTTRSRLSSTSSRCRPAPTGHFQGPTGPRSPADAAWQEILADARTGAGQ